MKYARLICLIVTVLSLFRCKSKEETSAPDPNSFAFPALFYSEMPVYRKASNIYGEWDHIRDNIFYSASITINKDGTFKYFDWGCTGKCYTEGKWTNEGPYLILRSDDKYRTKPAPLTLDTQIVQPKIYVKKPRKRKTNPTNWKIDTNLLKGFGSFTGKVNVTVAVPDTSKIYFERELFSFRDGFLYGVNANGRLSGSKYYKTRN